MVVGLFSVATGTLASDVFATSNAPAARTNPITLSRKMPMDLSLFCAVVARPRTPDSGFMRAIAALPRPNARIMRQTRRCLLVNDGTASMRQLREYCFLYRPREHWHYKSIRRALAKLGVARIGWGICATCLRHENKCR
jgi:hypothetical protein